MRDQGREKEERKRKRIFFSHATKEDMNMNMNWTMCILVFNKRDCIPLVSGITNLYL